MNCHHNAPQLRRLSESYGDSVVVVGVHSAKFPSEQLTASIREAVVRMGVTWPVVNDAGFQVWQQYAVRAWPTLALIDPEGRVVGMEAGELRAEDVRPLLDEMVARFAAKGALNTSPLPIRRERPSESEGPLAYPSRVLAAEDGRIFIADTGHQRVVEASLSPDGNSARVVRAFGSGGAGLQDGPAEAASFRGPRGLSLRGATLYVADTDNHAVRALDLGAGTVATVAGTGEMATGRLHAGLSPRAPLRSPWDVLAVEEGLLFIAMAGSHQVWALVGDERLGVFAGTGREALVDGPRDEASFNQPSGLAFGLGHLFVADAEASAIRAIALADDVMVATIIGQGLFEFGDADGTGAEVRLQHPSGIGFHEGRLFIADTYNHKVKTLDPTTGVVATLVGTGVSGTADGAFEEAELFAPEGVSAQGGRLYIADTNNHRIRVANLAERSVRTLDLVSDARGGGRL